MPIKYRAIHAGVPWKRVGTHGTLQGAIDGDKGAKQVLLGVGKYVQKLWAERGEPVCIFVWDPARELGHAFRLHPTSLREVQSATISVALLEQYDKAGGCAQAEVDRLFETSSPTRSIEASNTHSEVGDPLVAMEGAIREARVLSRGRNRALRAAALRAANGTCEACRVVFAEMFDGKGSRILQVHHRQQLALLDVPTLTSPQDLAVVCANCHALIHSNPLHALTVEEVRAVIAMRNDF